ncbi:Zinc finger RING-type [Arabidopsis suecica]|uniref:Zinc finger RING-type n=1 Tax=Arabidopsis suecica TaxID=45249 RepID=A0A8T2EJ25_ARASU|nr:Zinc finger RING-type [Arabidopsis suecica]
MSMSSRPEVEVHVTNGRKLSPSEPNSVIIRLKTKSVEIIIENQTTGRQTRRTQVSPPFLIDINLRSSSHDHIRTLLHDRLVGYPFESYLCDDLAPKISTAAIDLGFGHNGFTLTMAATVTYRTVSVMSKDEKSLRMVLLGRMKAEEFKSLKMETEPCSICLESLVSGPKPRDVTRMTCSHVFHNGCLLEWLKRKNTCPLCRTEIYD